MATSHSINRVEHFNAVTHTYLRFIQKVEISETLFYAGTPCWIWKGYIHPITKYGQFRFGSGLSSPHRFAYMYFFGDVPEGQEVDHMCHVRACCNPIHLQTLTHKDNASRRLNCYVNTGQCKNGHKMEGDNVRIGKNGKQYCRACTRENVKKFYAKNPGYNNKYGNERQKRYYAKKKAEREKLQVEQNQQSDN